MPQMIKMLPVRCIVVAVTVVCRLFTFALPFDVHSRQSLELYEGDVCQMGKGSSGKCTVTTKCPWFVSNVIQSKRVRYEDVPKCGFTVTDELICCPREEDKNRLGSGGGSHRKAVQACRNFVRGSSYIAQHIVEGEEVEDGEVPFIAALGYRSSEPGRLYDWGCGASWIANKYLLTAAHCVRSIQRPIVARMGVLNLEDTGSAAIQDSELKAFYSHPNFTAKSKYHDIAVIELVTAFKDDTNINKICLHADRQDMLPRHVLTASGWGLTDTDRSRSDILLKVELTTEPLDRCATEYRTQVGSAGGRLASGVIQQQYCAIGKRQKSGKRGDSCIGDSGGPLHYTDHGADRFYLVGITSFGLGCGESASIYTRVASYLDWIETIVWPDDASLLDQ